MISSKLVRTPPLGLRLQLVRRRFHFERRSMDMHGVGLFPFLNIAGIAAISLTVLVDSRCRAIVNWIAFPLLLEGAMVLWYVSKAS
jgi:hypothetical protein